MITKEQLQAMSDFQRNVKLFELLGGRACSLKERDNGDIVFENGCTLNYCNNPSDIMPLAFEHKISIFAYQYATTWVAQYYFDAVGINTVIHENPLRAIACCLILVLQEKQK